MFSPVLDAAQVRLFEGGLVDDLGIASLELMERAGRCCANHIVGRWPDLEHVGIVCGTGNNGGDGFVIARHLCALGIDVRLAVAGDLQKIHGDALVNFNRLDERGLKLGTIEEALTEVDVVIDALFGIGLNRALSEDHLAVVQQINQIDVPVVSIDMPSGLDASTGVTHGGAITAALTITFFAPKVGLLTGAGPAFRGQVVICDLETSASSNFASAVPAALRLDLSEVPDFPTRARVAHKGDAGFALLVGGNVGYEGAIRLAAQAATRAGAGLTAVVTHCENTQVTVQYPEIMCRRTDDPAVLRELGSRASFLAVGPGLGTDHWSQAMLRGVLAAQKPIVIDADALNLLAGDPARREDWILTPHPGEAARLLGCSSAEVQADRLAAAAEIQRLYGGIVVLKGAGTVIARAKQPPVILDFADPRLASGGMGDVLTGIIVAFGAQGLAPDIAAVSACWLHARACSHLTLAAGVLAGDVVGALPAVLSEIALSG
ncbi:MAG: NAD(P)H-hydrate dehydratase [Pseudomonadota bacterium]